MEEIKLTRLSFSPWFLRAIDAFLIALILFGVGLTLSRILLQYPNLNTFDPRMNVDSSFYVNVARTVLGPGGSIEDMNTGHSVGMQSLTTIWLWLFPEKGIFYFKLLNFLVWIGILLTATRLFFRVTFSFRLSLLFAAILSQVNLMSVYTAIVQHEIIMTFLLTLLLSIMSSSPTVKKSFGAGIVIAVASALRGTYVTFLPLFLILCFRSPGKTDRLGNIKALFAGFFLFSVPWNIFFSMRFHAPYFFFILEPHSFQRHLHANANPFNFPYVHPVGKYGAAFIYSEPGKYLLLLAKRFLYQFGFSRDVWFVDSWIGSSIETVFGMPAKWAVRIAATLSFGSFLLGIIYEWRHAARQNRFVRLLPAFFVLVICWPHLFAGTSTRFIVPVIPAMLILQLEALHKGMASLCENLTQRYGVTL